jgi:signal transduction histidine kinase
MFEKLRLKITIFNVVVFTVFMSVIIFSVYTFLYSLTGYSAQVFLSETANTIKDATIKSDYSGNINDFILTQNESNLFSGIGYDYIVWEEIDSEEEQFVINSMRLSDMELLDVSYELIVNFDGDESYQEIAYGSEYYGLNTLEFTGSNGNSYYVQVMQEKTIQNAMIEYVTMLLLLIGMISLSIIIPLSYVMAGRTLKPIRENYENQKKFIADASHELRTPLTVVKTNLEVLQMKENQTIKENEKWFKNIVSETDSMSRLVSELLLLAQAENKQVEIVKKDFDLSYLCNEMVQIMENVALEKNIVLTGNIAENVNCFGDHNRLRQVIRILIDNAIKYTDDNGNVSLNLCEDKNTVTFSVVDDGVGLTEEEKERIFERFFRADKSRHRAEGGVGLGLNIAQWIVGSHDGKIKVKTEKGQGSSFIVTLPKKGSRQAKANNNKNK